MKALADGLLHEPERIEIAPEQARTDAIVQRAIHVDTALRTPLLRHLLETEGWARALVFVATKYATELVSDKLWAKGIKAAALHGELSQGARTKVLAALRSGEVQVLVATDVAARGLDIPELPAVVNYDLPRASGEYTHRIGRTGRAGETGVAVSFIPADAESHFRLIEKRQGRRVAREQIAGFEPKEIATEAQATGGVKGRAAEQEGQAAGGRGRRKLKLIPGRGFQRRCFGSGLLADFQARRCRQRRRRQGRTGREEVMLAAQPVDQRRDQLAQFAAGDHRVGVELFILLRLVMAFEDQVEEGDLLDLQRVGQHEGDAVLVAHRQLGRALAALQVLAHFLDVQRVAGVAGRRISSRPRSSARTRGRS